MLLNWILSIALGTLAAFILYEGINQDLRPEAHKWIDDPRNGCIIHSSTPLANTQTGTRPGEFETKYLNLYTCVNNQTAAIISSTNLLQAK